jgi:hypothetical protein
LKLSPTTIGKRSSSRVRGYRTLPPGSVTYQPEADAKGQRHVWLPPNVVDGLSDMRGPGESYSDVILRIAVQKYEGITPGLYAVRLGGGTKSGATFRV